MNNAKITKVYDIQLLGEREVVAGMQNINKEIDRGKKLVLEMKNNLVKNANLFVDPVQLEKEREALIKAEKALISETARKKEAKAEAEALRAARQEEKNQLLQQEQGNKRVANSYNDLLVKIRQLKAEQKNKINLLNINDSDLQKSNEEIRKLQDRINAFNRSLSSEGTNVGEYTRGLVNALKSANLEGILGNQINGVKQKVHSLDEEFIILKQNLLKAQNAGGKNLSSIEQNIIANRMEAEKLNSQLKTVNKTIESVGNIGYQVSDSLKKNFDSVTTSVKNLVLGYVGFHAALELTRKMKDSAYELSDQTTNLEIELEKATGGADNLVNSLSKLDTRTKLTVLTDIAFVASKAGVAEQNMLGVTEAVDKASIAFGKDFGSIEEGTETFAKLINIFYEDREITGQRILQIGNSIRTLANETVASVPFINDFNGRMAGLKQMFSNFNLSDSIGLGAGFEEFKQSAEVASTALVKVLPKLASDTEKYSKIIGKTKKEFSDLINNNPAEALIQVAEALVKNGADVEEVSKAFGDAELGSGRIATILSTLGGKADVFRERIKRAGETIQETTAIEEAFNKKNENFAATIDKINKKISDLGNNKSFQKLLYSLSSLLLGLITIILNIPFGWWIAGLSLLTIAYWNNVTALSANILQKTIYIARITASNALILVHNTLLIAINASTLILNNTYKILNTTMMVLGTIIPGLRSAWLFLNTTMLATPLGWLLAGLVAVSTATYALAQKSEVASKSIKEKAKSLKESAEQLRIQNEITKKANESTTESISKLDTLTKVVKDNKLSLETRKEALRRLIEISPQYLKNLTLENIATEEGTRILDEYKNKILEVARAKASEELLSQKLKEKKEIELSLPDLAIKKQEREETYNKLTFKSIVQDFKQVGKDLGISEGDDIDIYNDKIKKVTELAKEIKILEKDVVEYKTKEIKDSIVNKGGNGETKTGTYKGSKLNGQQKDFLKDVDAIRDTLLANNEKAYTKAEITEKEYLSAIFKINDEAWTKKLNYIKGVNAEERKQRAQWQNEQAKLEKDTQEKLFKIDDDALNKRFSLEKKKINNSYKAIIDDPYSTELEKIEAEQEYNYKLLDITLDFNNSMDELEKNYNQNIIESANARATELEEIERKINNTSYKLTEERFQNIKNIVNNAVDSTINEKNINAELEKQKVLLDSNLTTRQKENEINRISFLNEADETEAELERIRDLINLYNQKLINSTLTVDQQKELNNLLGKESELITRNIENKTKQNKIGFGVGKIDAPSDSNTQNLIKEKILNDLNLDEDAFGSMIGTAISQSWDLASTAMNGYFDAEEARINKSRELAYERIDLEKEQLLAQAQSQAERDSLEKQATEKKKQADSVAAAQLKKSKKAEAKIALATEMSNIWSTVWQLGPIAGAIMGVTLSAMAMGRYATNINSINSTQFKKGGLFNPKKFAKGGRLTGPSHNQGGIPAINPTTGEQVAELEGEEGIINKRSMKDNSIYSVTGTPSQIASRINAIGGGVDWMGGATMQKFMKGGTYLGSNLQPPVFKSYYDTITQKEKENYNAERLDRIEKNLEKTAQSLNREVNRKTIVSSRELSRVQKENNKQSQIATL
ncbi:hypothetical protein ETU09_05775 [Apibacter muscae]|uniref:Phage tail tape measure protein n=1 Tax=Apibacter muscae TaxID=2509004 RepID=A0A563DE76_9FLAO|nr:hypothetical protein [Apibacter muscae]TWP28432.1 hypothetical protein ETU09_05775 [Apibacter muscae]